MKVLTLTCHRVFNYGAVLQAYGLQKYLIDKDIDTEIIDYYPSYVNNNPSQKVKENLFLRWVWTASKVPDRLRGKRIFDEFINKHLRLTSRIYFTSDDLYQNAPIADIYIVGSDQVWNTNMPNGNDDSYFLKFVPAGKKKLSYAASIAIDKLDEFQKTRMRKLLSDFSSVSVREVTGANILKSIGCKSVRVVLDPVYLLSREHWISFSDGYITKDKYVLVYCFGGQVDLIRYAHNLASVLGYKVYIINTKFYDYKIKAHKNFWMISPQRFVSLFNNAEHVVTNSFHGLSFSLIFNKKVHVFNQHGTGNSRLKDMLNSVGLESRMLKYDSKNLMLEEINYEQINEKLGIMIGNSKQFLKDGIMG